MKYKIGDIVLFHRKGGFIISLIRKFTQSKYSHAALIIQPSSYDPDKVCIIDSRGGPHLEKWQKGVTKRYIQLSPDSHHVYRHTRIDKALGHKIKKKALTYLGAGYDYWGVLYRALLTITFCRRRKNRWNDPDKPYCSELIANAYSPTLTFNTEIPVANISPADIANSKHTFRVAP